MFVLGTVAVVTLVTWKLSHHHKVVTLAAAIQESVYGRVGIRLEPEPVVV